MLLSKFRCFVKAFDCKYEAKIRHVSLSAITKLKNHLFSCFFSAWNRFMLISIRKVMQAMQRPIPEDKIVQSNEGAAMMIVMIILRVSMVGMISAYILKVCFASRMKQLKNCVSKSGILSHWDNDCIT